MNYVLQLDLGDGFGKADAALDNLLSKISKIKNPVPGTLSDANKKNAVLPELFSGNLSNAVIDKAIDKSGFLKSGEGAGENYSKGIKGGILKSGVLTGIMATLFNPFVGARMLSNALDKGGKENGLFGKGGAMGYGQIFVAIKSLELAFSGLKKIVHETAAAYENARLIYAKSMMSGLGLGFTVKRGMLANILGVSETEVIRFGAAWSYLNPKIAWASKVLAETATPLAAVGWEFKILQENFKALWAKIAFEASPAIKTMIEELNQFIKTIDISAVAKSIAFAINGMKTAMEYFLWWLQQIGKLLPDSGVPKPPSPSSILNTFGGPATRNGFWGPHSKEEEFGMNGAQPDQLKRIGSAFGAPNQYEYSQRKILENALLKLSPESIASFMKANGASAMDIQMAESLARSMKKIGSIKNTEPPPPALMMKQLPASTWEKMGLNIGGGLQAKALDYQRRTAVTIEKIYQQGQKAAQKTSGYYMGRNPNVAGY